jgi:hypothetical protein
MSLGTTNAADYTQIGFDAQAFYFGANMFNQAGSAYVYDEIFGASKARMDAGLSVSAFGFFNLSVNGHLVDTVQPVEVQNAPTGPRSGIFINSFNINGDPFGDNCFSTACRGVEVWALRNPGTSSTALNGIFVNTQNYIVAPSADQPGCTQCIETLDTRISGTPVDHDDLVSFGLDTGRSNGSQIVPQVYWGQVAPVLNDAGTITSATLFQNGYYGYSGDGAAFFPAFMPDDEGNLFMVFEFSGNGFAPSSAYVSRRATFARGLFHDLGIFLFSSTTPTFDSRWGDYEATSYDGRTPNSVWIAGEHSGSNSDWATGIGRLRLPLSLP